MKRKTIFSLTILILLLFLGFNLNSLDIQAASSGSFQEDFDDTSYMDSSNSNVSLWGSGHIELPRKNPLYQDLLKVSTTGNSMFVDGNYAYLGGAYDGMYILDITSPDALTLEGYYNDSAEINWVYACVVRDNIAYLANAGDGLLILNVTDKTAPTKLGEIDLYHGLDVALKGNYAYVAAYSGGIRAIDISNPVAPSDVSGYVNVSADDAEGVAVSGDYLYVAVSHAGLDVYDISTPTTPVFVSNVDLDGYAKKVEIKDDYAYVSCDLGGLQIVDISDPTNMTRAVWLDSNTRFFGVDVDGNYVYVAGRSGSSDHKMKIYDISDPEKPIPAGIYNLPQVGHDVFVVGDYAYVVASSAGVLSLRIADPGGHFGGLYGHYAEAVSNIIYFASAGETFERAFLYPTRTIDPDTSIVYYLSADGGAHWESVSPGVELSLILDRC
ncbi:MAG: LVIVD repeat-containing protein [Candidatus Heimdallarchaeaceae archaeon]